jgi:hypothetical protein
VKKVLHNLRTIIALMLLAAMALASTGCLLVAAGAAGGAAVGYAYYKGKITDTFAAGLDDTRAATHTALAELGMPIVKEDRTPKSATIDTRTADDDHVRIKLEPIKSSIPAEGEITRVSVRVATFGDRPVSDRVLYQISLHLAPARYIPPVTGQPTPQPLVQTGGAAPQTAPPPLAAPQQTAPPPLAAPQQTTPPPQLPPTPVPAAR